jgi:hypothetical protein
MATPLCGITLRVDEPLASHNGDSHRLGMLTSVQDGLGLPSGEYLRPRSSGLQLYRAGALRRSLGDCLLAGS